MTDPELTIVIPVYNGRKYLQDTLDSLVALEQMASCELIFQDCKSTDGTSELLEDFCQNHSNRFHFNEQDSGQSDAIDHYKRARIGVYTGLTEHGTIETENEVYNISQYDYNVDYWTHHHNPRTVLNNPAGEITMNLGIDLRHRYLLCFTFLYFFFVSFGKFFLKPS